MCESTEDPIPPPLAAFIAGEVCAALDYIHTRKSSQETPLRIVHRDVSPHNILVSNGGEVKLADFGIAKSIIREDRTTRGTIKGKFSYMSPEQATPGAPIDARTDLFSLGAVLYEMLFGRPPFRGQSDVDTLERVRRCTFDLEDRWLSDADRPLFQILWRCLQREPGQRYPHAAALAADLQQYIDAVPEPGTTEALGAWVQQTVHRDRRGGMGQIVDDLFDTGRAGGTAVVASREASYAEQAVQPTAHGEARPATVDRPRGTGSEGRTGVPKAWLQMVIVALAASGVTLALAWRFMSRPPAATTRAPRAAVSGSDVDGGAA
jgi:serine/threonine-protein kinase